MLVRKCPPETIVQKHRRLLILPALAELHPQILVFLGELLDLGPQLEQGRPLEAHKEIIQQILQFMLFTGQLRQDLTAFMQNVVARTVLANLEGIRIMIAIFTRNRRKNKTIIRENKDHDELPRHGAAKKIHFSTH